MHRFTSILSRHWFSIGAILLISLSAAKRIDVPALVPIQSEISQPDKSTDKKRTLQAATQVQSPKKVMVTNTPPVKNNGISAANIQKEWTHQKFITRFSKVAINEMEKFGIPASIILAHALLESNGVTGDLNHQNNFFNLPCQQKSTKNCVRKYKTAWFSFRDHSKYMTTGKFKYLPRIPIQNKEQWAKDIQAIGYPNQINYDDKLLDIIQLYQLDQFDIIGKKA